MFSVSIRSHVMIAHSFNNPAFGPAQRLHGATYVVDAEFRTPQLNNDNIVIDIDLATRKLNDVLEPLRYRNLDEMPEFAGKLTTTEFLAWYIHKQIVAQVRQSFSGILKVTLHESHVAWGAYEAGVQ